ncbi:MAG: BatA and WFA domain-containing protein [Thermodesulfobacteriota bacterium]
MVFTNPWGLAALLSVPAIVFLHFFRRSKKAVVIGGLHLWRHAPARKPAGEHFTRLFKNLSLLFSVLAAVLLSLLLSGMDIPRHVSGRHLVFVLDDSFSMGARKETSAAERARQAVREQAQPGDFFTLIAAGQKPRLLAGPMAAREELEAALASWSPEALSCDAPGAAELAGKFLPPGNRAVFITDDPRQSRGLEDVFSALGVGVVSDNTAIVFTDRFRAAGGKDRVLAVVQSFGKEPRSVLFSVATEETKPEPRKLDLAPDRPVSVTLDLDAADQVVSLFLEQDSLAADNRVNLAPLSRQPVRVAGFNMGKARESLVRAVMAVPGAVMTEDVAEASLVFVFAPDFSNALFRPAWDDGGNKANIPSWDLSRYPKALVLCFLPGEGTARDGNLALAQGRDVWMNEQDPVAGHLDTSGLLWPYIPLDRRPADATVLAETRGRGIFFLREDATGPAQYYLDLVWEAGNLFRTNAWPLFVNELAARTRERAYGVDGTNFRAGRTVRVNPPPASGERFTMLLEKDGARTREIEFSGGAPLYLSDLSPGRYRLLSPDGKTVSRFCVNAFAPAESDLRQNSSLQGEGSAGEHSAVTRKQENRLLYYIMLGLGLAFLGLALVFHDLSR